MKKHTRALAEFVYETDIRSIPEPVIKKACDVMLDTLACAAAGYTAAAEECGWAVGLAKSVGGNGESTVLIDGYKTSAMMAAFANAAMVHTIDFDDTHLESVAHLGSGLLGTVLAVGESLHKTGGEVLAAFILGFEVAARTGNAVNKGAVHYHYKYWHPTATGGAVGCAAAAAKLMGLDPDGIEMAIGLGADQASGFRYCLDKGDFSKTLHPAWAAMRGVMAAQIIKLGASGPKGLLEYPTGYCNALCEAPNIDYLTEGLGGSFAIMKDALKMYPSIHGSHSGIEATINLVTDNDIAAEDIQHVLIKLSPLAKGQGVNYAPENVLAARLSIPCCIALAFTRRHVLLGDFSEERLNDRSFLEQMKKVEIQPCPEFNDMYPLSGFTSEATIKLKDGRSFTELVAYCKGHPERPVSPEDIKEKYFSLCELTWPHSKAEKVYEYFGRLTEEQDIGQLMKLCNEG